MSKVQIIEHFSKFLRKNSASLLTSKPVSNIDVSTLRYVPSENIGKDTVKFETSINAFKNAIKNSKRKSVTEKLTDRIFEKIGLEKPARPDNYIQPSETDFPGLKQARAYGKERAIKAIEGDNPYEHMVVIDKNTNKVTGEYKGNENNVNISLFESSRFPHNSSIEHGHRVICNINGKPATTPVSWPDYTFLSAKGEDIIAFDINGRFSMLAKNPNFKPLTVEQLKEYEYLHRCYMYPEEKYLPEILKYLPKEFQEIKSYKELKEKVQKLTELGDLTLDIKQNLREASKKLNIIGEEQLRGIDQFWKDYADELGVIYKTNYEWLM